MLNREQDDKVWKSFNQWFKDFVDCNEDMFLLDVLLTIVVRGSDGFFNATLSEKMDSKDKDYFRSKRNQFVSTYLMQNQIDPRVFLREEFIELQKDLVQLLNDDSFPDVKTSKFVKDKRFRQAKATLTKQMRNRMCSDKLKKRDKKAV